MIRKINKFYIIYIVVFTLLYFFSRIIFLDSDLPLWDIGHYQPIDEFYYSVDAFNLYHYGIYDLIEFDFILHIKYVTNYFTEILVSIFLSIFGNNYYGLRMASVFSGFVISMIIFYIFYIYQKKENLLNSKYIFIYASIYLLVDFSFLLSNRILEPTIFRMLAFMIIFIVTIKLTSKPLNRYRSFILGFLAFISVWYVYFTNIFIIPSIGLYILIISMQENNKNFFTYILYYILGVLVASSIFYINYYLVFDSSYTLDFIDFYVGMSNRISHLFDNIYNIFSTNIFKFNPIFLFLTFLTLPIFIYIVFKKRDKISILLFSFILLFFSQTFFINDYYQRKLIFMLPMLMLMLMFVMLDIKIIFLQIEKHKLYKFALIGYLFIIFILTIKGMGMDTNFSYLDNINHYTILFLILLLGIYSIYIIRYKRKLFEFIVLIFSLFIILESYYDKYYFDNKVVFILPILILLFLIYYLTKKSIYMLIINNNKLKLIIIFYTSLFIVYILFYYKDIITIFHYMTILYIFIFSLLYINLIKIDKYFKYILILMMFLSNIIMDFKYIYIQPTYKYRTTMIELSKYINNQYTIGLSHGFRLYNSSKPLMNSYGYQDKSYRYNRDKKDLLDHNITLYKIKYLSKLNRDKNIIAEFNINNEQFQNKIILIKCKNEK